MTAVAPELGDVDSAFSDAIAADAGAAVDHGPPVAPPPKKSDNPDAPHGLAEDGTPLAPYGHKADGRPRIKPGGPGRARVADDRARVAPMRPASSPGPSSGPAADGPDYSEQLADFGTTIWLAGSMLRGGRLFILPIPDARPYAAVFKHELPGLVGAFNVAARQSPQVRGYVERVSGEGAWSWKVGVAVTCVGFVASCAEMAKAPPEIKAAAAAANDAQLEQFMTAQIAELGLEPAQPVTDGPAGQDQAAAA